VERSAAGGERRDKRDLCERKRLKTLKKAEKLKSETLKSDSGKTERLRRFQRFRFQPFTFGFPPP
jgi:hypothetical protein